MHYPADLHVHSTFSSDAHDDLEAMCRSAMAKGIKYICFTEHLDLNPTDEGYGFFDYSRFSAAIDRARAEFGESLTILKGVEFGEPHLYPREFEQWASRDFDLILGAVHLLDNRFVGDPAQLMQFTPDQLMERYYHEVMQAVRFGGFDVLAHFDFPKRYLRRTQQQMPDFSAITDDILRELSRRGIALEINISPLRKGLPECSPDVPIIRKFLDAGGQHLTIGSDAHRQDDIATGYEHVKDIFAAIDPAFRGRGVFIKRKFFEI